MVLPAIHALVTSTETEHDKRVITTEQFIHEQITDYYCRQASSTVGLPSSTFHFDRNGFLVRFAPVDGAGKKVIPKSLQARPIYHSHYPTLLWHLGERLMHESMWQEHYLPDMAIFFYKTVRDCCKYVRSKPSKKRRHPPTTILPSSPLQFVSMNTLRQLTKMLRGSQFVLVMKNRYKNLTRALLICNTTALNIASMILNICIIPYGILDYVLTENRAQFLSKFF